MFVNPNLLPAIVLAVLSFLLGRWLAQHVTQPWARAAVLAVAVVGCLPALLFLGYYLHVIREPLWYVEWRSVPGIEICSAFSALLPGYLADRMPPRRRVRRGIIGMCAVLVLAPYLKPVLLPVALGAHWADRWPQGVCLQSSPSTCGPAALATVLARAGIHRTEREIARATYTCASGTELWYLLRYARRQGVHAVCRHQPHIAAIAVPAILGTRISSYGHFIILLACDHGRVTIGDPISGRTELTEAQFHGQYQFDGCVLEIHR